ncbi:hypothetical protein [Fimbriiglobus ruber]|uniref:Uncharacterized protein n=1 Tax=Fimbriiglobus ruber TaxID=1908690 RepID=A0A225E8Q2_9BACT|nr:hypothetical protein [Fimbriiglobus ruber]OWK44995.1 hypothetical protein FRUB_01326 [Fimbriiglobus ruber]
MLAVLHKMMRKNPDERFQTPSELFDALAPWVDDAPIPPPVHEMPDLCPAVLALTGHAADRAKGASRLSVNSSRGGYGGSSGSSASYVLQTGPGSGSVLGSSTDGTQAQVPTRTGAETSPMSPPRSDVSLTPAAPGGGAYYSGGGVRDSEVDIRATLEYADGRTSRVAIHDQRPWLTYALIVALLIALLAIAGLAAALLMTK